MGSPERIRNSTRQETEEDIEVNIDSVKDDDDWVVDDKKKQCSSKSRKMGNVEDVDGFDVISRKRSLSDRHESLKRVSSSSRADTDHGDYEIRKESRSKQVKRKPDENTLDVLGTWYEDGKAENKRESERKKSSSKYSEHNADVVEYTLNRVSRDSSRKDHNIREKGHRRKWDEPENVCKSVNHEEKSDVRSGKSLEPKFDSSEKEKSEPLETELNDVKDKCTKSCEKEESRVDSDSKSSRGGRSKFVVETNKHEDVSSKEWSEEHKQQRNDDEDVNNTLLRDKSRRDLESHNSRTSEKIGMCDMDNLDTDYKRSISFRRKELGKDASWDDRFKGRDRENTIDSWKRKQDKEMRDWELLRHGRGGDRIDGYPGGRKDGSRTEAVKTSSNYGISNENYDVIEIQTKPFNIQQLESKPASDSEERFRNAQGPSQSGEDIKDRLAEGDDNDSQAEKSRSQKVTTSSRGTGSSLPSLGGPQELGSYSRSFSQGARGNNRMGRAGRGRPSERDNQQSGMPMPLVGSTFGPLGLSPPGPLQSLPPNMSPAPGPISPGVFIPPFQPPTVWSGGRGFDMNMLGAPHGLPLVPSGPLGPRFSPALGNSPSSGLIFNPSGPGREMPPSLSSLSFNTMPPVVRGHPQEKGTGGWAPLRNNVPPGKAPSRGEQNDYSQNFVDTGMRPQNYIRELELTSVVEDYPKLRELIQKKDEIVAKSASPPMYYKCDLREQVLSPEFIGTKFDAILVDPPWEEYVHRAPGVTDHMDYWTFEEIMNLKIEAIADTPSFIFLWVGDGVGLEQGRQCLKKWGFRRCEDICWVKTNKANATPGLRHDSHTLFQRSKEHCLMGIKGTVRRSTDGHIIHANIDTDVIIAEEPPYGSTAKPEDMYRIIEHFALGRRRLELFGEDHNIRSGWLTVGNGLSSSNFNSEAYIRNFADKDGKMWLGGGGRNPPPESPHLVLTTPDIESLRPKSPMKNQQQQQQSASISLATASSSNKRPANSPQKHNMPNLTLEGSSSNMPSPAPRTGGNLPPDGMLDMYGGEFLDYESHRGTNMNML